MKALSTTEKYTKEELLKFYSTMHRIRYFEEKGGAWRILIIWTKFGKQQKDCLGFTVHIGEGWTGELGNPPDTWIGT